MWVFGHCSSASFMFDSKLRNARMARTLSALMPLLPWFTWWHCCVEYFGGLPYLPTGSGEMFFFRELTTVVSVEHVVGRDVGCCKIWMIWRQAASFMSRLVWLINSNISKSVYWLSLQWEWLLLLYNITQLLASVSSNIPGIFWDNHHDTSFPSMNVLFTTDNCEILAVVHLHLPLEANNQHQTHAPEIVGRWETPATFSHPQQDSSWVECTRRLLLIPFWLEANFIFLRTSHLFSLSSSSPIPLHQFMAKQTPQPSESGSESSRLTGFASNASLAGAQQRPRHQWVHHDAANTATKNITEDAHLKTVRNTRSSKNMTQHAIGWEYSHITVNFGQLAMKHAVGIRRPLPEPSIAAHNRKPPWPVKAFDRTER